MDLTKLFQYSVMEEFTDIMSDSVKSMSINNTSEWWALRTSLDVRMKVNNTVQFSLVQLFICLCRFIYKGSMKLMWTCGQLTTTQ